MPIIAFYPGSFDPPTHGHLDVLLGALHIADEVVVGIGVHHEKSGLFTYEEREQLIFSLLDGGQKSRVTVVAFSGLSVDEAQKHGARMMVRGIRDSSDFNYEMQLSGMNKALNGGIQTVFLPASSPYRHITASLVRQIASMGGDISSFVAPGVAQALAKKYHEQ